ncbi:hypothetical protein [Falsiroseomonas selenitidurans]|uniref:Uncharacterized protein n=1 Tax=Falsiroseomonas selenitidurans TaxID=2716335 RepID=A0ABX1E4Y0_9PROT|nr:hypothetical protein [Falsiroseomonas selenitidurans]NKC32254.1 hypothetical protein [Falsiroseomonas selenitidurans]
MTQMSRRLALLGPILLFRPAHADRPVPLFPAWVGRTARLRSTGGDARLLLQADGTGLLAVRALFRCRPLPVLSWRMAPDGRELTYRRQAAISASRIVEGTARIDADGTGLVWEEAREQRAEFDGFEAAAAAGTCL